MVKSSTKELSMRKIKEIIRLAYERRESLRMIAKSCSVSPNTVKKYIKCLEQKRIAYDDIKKLDDESIASILEIRKRSGRKESSMPEWNYIHTELKRKGVTLVLLWQEYKQQHPDGYQLSQFCYYYRMWYKKLSPTMRNTHKAGETMFVDYAGQTIPVYDTVTGTLRQAQLFVATLGMSNYTYAEATWTQQLPDWIHAHENAFSYFGGVTERIVPDNLKAGVTRACRYEPDINPTYNDMAIHYDTVIIPARARRPRDKAKVENAVLIVERWILASIRNRKFFSLQELNQAISELLDRLNTKPFQKLEGTRKSWFETYEQPALAQLPSVRYQFAEWKKARVNIDYHIEIGGHYYSVPYRHVRETVDVRFSSTTVEIFRKGLRIASHLRSQKRGFHTTQPEHMPKAHQDYLGWTPSKLIEKGTSIGAHTALLMERILDRRSHPVQGYRSCLGIMRLAKRYTSARVESACGRALAIGGLSYKSVESILRNNLDRERVPEQIRTCALHHENIRGSNYFSYQIHTRKEDVSC